MGRSNAARVKTANSELLENGKVDRVSNFFSQGYVIHATGRSLSWGRIGVQRFVRSLRRAFPDLEVDVEILVQSKDRVAWQRTIRGTHKRKYKGFPASGSTVVWRDMVTSRFTAGLVVEDWVISDLAESLLRSRAR